MCGINGFNFNNEELINNMNEETKHRGPDDRGTFIDDNISLGHNRLSIIDLSSGGHQPMFSHDGNLVIVFNGEIYNYKELRRELEKRGKKFATKSDTEVILQAYEEYGHNCLNKFNGIFAFAIWDKHKQELFLARDYIGVKPLFYYFDGKKIIFSSEIKGILKHNIGRNLNFNALNLYFRFLYINGPETIWEKIYKLPPATFMIVTDNNKISMHKYWKIKNYINFTNKEDIKNKIRDTLKNAVNRQIISDVPVGLFLSGGIDSTILLGLMREFNKNKIKTFSTGFDINREQEKFNGDYFLAKKTSKYYGTEHHELVLTSKDMENNLEKVIWHMDDLVSNHIQVANFLLAKEAKKEVKVILGGDGGDELFGGYDRYYYYYLIDKWQKIPKVLRDNFLNKQVFSLLQKEKIYEKINLTDKLNLFWTFMAQKEDIVGQFLNPEINDLPATQNYIRNNNFMKEQGIDLAKRMMLADLETWLVDESLVRSDKMGMAWGLEQRVPLLDKEVVELAMRISTKYKINSAKQGKLIYKEALKEYIPDFIYNKKKTGWFSPASKWLRGGMKNMAYEILSENFNRETSSFFNFKEIKHILDDHISCKKYALNTIWSLMTFQIWYKKFNRPK